MMKEEKPMSDVRLIERWLPIAEIGAEGVRERTPMTPFPAPNRLHVWWARRPLIASRAAILASMLPPTADQAKFLWALGIHGDPIASKRRIERAKRSGERFEGEAYAYKRAFTYTPSPEELDDLGLLNRSRFSVLDPTAGGGSIPFEGMRLGLASFANDLNPVAALILEATVDYPRRFKDDLVHEYKSIAKDFVNRRELKIRNLYPKEPKENSLPTNFIWARTITCPYCEGRVPLSPNWKLNADGLGVKIVPRLGSGPNSSDRRCTFEIVESPSDHSLGTISGGDATCPYADCARVIDGDEVKRQAQAGDMGEQLYAVIYKTKIERRLKSGKLGKPRWERGYRAPIKSDDNSLQLTDLLSEKLAEWQALDLVPNEEVPTGNKTDEALRYGTQRWVNMFSPRQLLVHGYASEVFREMVEEDRAAGRLSGASVPHLT